MMKYFLIFPIFSLKTYLILSVIILLATAVWTCCQHFYYRKYLNYPPGPLPWPLIGNVLQVNQKHIYLSFMEWSKTYGKILSVKLGLHKALVIHDPSRVRELFHELEFSGRPQAYFVTVLSGGSNGILVSQGGVWEAQRRFTLRHLRDFGFGKNTMETLIMEDALEVVKWMKSEKGNPLPHLQRRMSLAVLNSLWTIVSGQRFSQDDGTLKSLLDSLQEGAKAITRHPLLIVAPWIRHILPSISGYTKFQKVVDKMTKYFWDTIDEHKEMMENYENESSRDFIDAYLREIKRTDDPNSSFFENEGEKNLRAVIGDLFQGGSETTGLSLTWAILFLMTHPGVQKKLQKEIDTVVGHSRNPTLYDRLKMPYTEACILETARMASVIPLGVFHSSLVDTHFHDYFIPEATWIWANIYAIHMDSHTWGDPQNFNPERFLSKDGTRVLRSHESLMPFSVGKRECIGKSLANDTMFLFITTLFQRFTAVPAPDCCEPDILGSNDGFFRAPKDFSVIMKERATVLNNPITFTLTDDE